MADKLGLDYDEVVILQETNVAHGGVMANYTDELILTNKKIICIHMGIFGGKKTTYHYPLEQIKVYNGMPQAQFGKLSNGNKTLSIYFLNGEEQFFFQSSNNKTIEKWISEIQKLFGCEVKNKTKEKNNKKSKYEIEDDSILGAFKEVGNSFKEVGLDFAEAFGIKRKNEEPTLDEEDSDDEEEECEVMSKYQLENDEIVLMRSETVYVSGSVDCTADIVLLTNKNLVIEYTTGFLNNKYHIDKYPLIDVKEYKNTPQVKLGEHDDSPVLEIYFANAQLLLNFDEVGNEKKQKQFINEWIIKVKDAISDLSTNDDTGAEDNKVCQYCGKALPLSAIFCTNCGTKYQQTEKKVVENNRICRNCGSKIAAGLNFCTECGSAVEFQTNVPERNSVKNTECSADSKNEIPKEKLSIDQQIELLQKLKSLVDAGVLSQEEFEKKKKEIL